MLILEPTYDFFTLFHAGIDFGNVSLSVIVDLIYLIFS